MCDITNEVNEALAARGYTLTAELISDDFNGHDGSHTFSVKLERNGQTLETDYTSGCGHRHYPRREIMNILSAPKSYAKGAAIEYRHYGLTVDELAQRKRTVPDVPTLADIMGCVVIDAQSVSGGQTFEDFAEESGYDKDSRQAEKVYNGCRDHYFALVRMGDDLDELSELCSEL